jgi:hypothetical protein
MMRHLTFLTLITHGIGALSSFHVQYPWATRATPKGDRDVLRVFDPFCGEFQAFLSNNGPILTFQQATSFAIRNPSRDTSPHSCPSQGTPAIWVYICISCPNDQALTLLQ